MKKVSKSVLKAKMFEYFRELESQGGELIVTDFGKPVLKIVPCVQKRSIDVLFGELRSKAKVSREAALEGTEMEWSES